MTPTVNGTVVRQLLRAAGLAGVSPAALGARDWSLRDLDFEDRVPEATVLAMWEAATRLVGRTIPLDAARAPRAEHRSLALYACVNMPNVAAILSNLVRFSPLITSCEHWYLDREPNRTRLVAQSSEASGFGGLVQLEFSVLDMVHVSRTTTVLRDLVLGVTFAHPCPADAYSDSFGIPVQQCAPQTAIEVASDALEWQLPDANPGLSATLVARLDAMLESSIASVSLVDRLEAWIARRLPGETTLELAAQDLAVSPRTLQRRLADENIGYRAVVDRVRFRLARQWLPNIDGSNVAERLGYSDSRALRRAFRRWTGTSPRQWLQSVRDARH